MQIPVVVHQPHHAHTVPSAAEQTSTGKPLKLDFALVLLSLRMEELSWLPNCTLKLWALRGWLCVIVQVGLNPLTITPTGGKAAMVTFTDFIACDAIEHVLDTVLLPESVSSRRPLQSAS